MGFAILVDDITAGVCLSKGGRFFFLPRAAPASASVARPPAAAPPQHTATVQYSVPYQSTLGTHNSVSE